MKWRRQPARAGDGSEYRHGMVRFAPAGWAVMLTALIMEMAALRFGSAWVEAGCGLIWGAVLTDFIACALLRRRPLVLEVRQEANHAGERVAGRVGTLAVGWGVSVGVECEGTLTYGTLPEYGGALFFSARAKTRGIHTWPKVVLRCSGPLALCFVNVAVRPSSLLVVWPARWPEARVPRPQGAGREALRHSSDAPGWIRDWRPDDGLRRIAQKASARAGKWIATPPAPEKERLAVTLGWAVQRCGGDLEMALSLIGRIIEDADARGESVRVGLREGAWLEGSPPSQMRALAEYTPGGAA